MSPSPDLWWSPVVLAIALLSDAVRSLRPPKFIRDCLNGVRFPRDWWWTLIVIKMLAVVGLVAGIWIPGITLAANTCVIVYSICAAAAHIRVRFLGQAFWINCLGMLALSVVALVLSYAL